MRRSAAIVRPSGAQRGAANSTLVSLTSNCGEVVRPRRAHRHRREGTPVRHLNRADNRRAIGRNIGITGARLARKAVSIARLRVEHVEVGLQGDTLDELELVDDQPAAGQTDRAAEVSSGHQARLRSKASSAGIRSGKLHQCGKRVRCGERIEQAAIPRIAGRGDLEAVVGEPHRPRVARLPGRACRWRPRSLSTAARASGQRPSCRPAIPGRAAGVLFRPRARGLNRVRTFEPGSRGSTRRRGMVRSRPASRRFPPFARSSGSKRLAAAARSRSSRKSPAATRPSRVVVLSCHVAMPSIAHTG